MKNIKPNKGLIKEVNDMREMMRKLETSKHQPQQLNEQIDGCQPGICPDGCTCVDIYGNNGGDDMPGGNGVIGFDCCCGNETIGAYGCEPGPCVSHTDCTTDTDPTNGQVFQVNPGYECCYYDSYMASIDFPSCNHSDDCHSYSTSVGSNPTTGLIMGCMSTSALNYNPNANSDNGQCCTVSNSGCINEAYINGDEDNECDCENNWVDFGYGNVGCCLVPLQGGGSNNPNSGGGIGITPGTPPGYITLDDLSSLPQNPNCFIGETLITMEDESNKRIDEVKVGDIVKSEINTSTIISIDVHNEKEYVVYSLNNSKAFVTEEHPFKTTIGWKSINPVETFKKHGVESNVLEIGNLLITKEGTEELKTITESSTTVDTVYNLRLDNELVYYADGFLVHNAKNIDDSGTGGTDGPGFEPADPIDGPLKPNKPNKPLPNASKTRRK